MHISEAIKKCVENIYSRYSSKRLPHLARLDCLEHALSQIFSPRISTRARVVSTLEYTSSKAARIRIENEDSYIAGAHVTGSSPLCRTWTTLWRSLPLETMSTTARTPDSPNESHIRKTACASSSRSVQRSGNTSNIINARTCFLRDLSLPCTPVQHYTGALVRMR